MSSRPRPAAPRAALPPDMATAVDQTLRYAPHCGAAAGALLGAALVPRVNEKLMLALYLGPGGVDPRLFSGVTGMLWVVDMALVSSVSALMTAFARGLFTPLGG